jgi:hypothetical protein
VIRITGASIAQQSPERLGLAEVINAAPPIAYPRRTRDLKLFGD